MKAVGGATLALILSACGGAGDVDAGTAANRSVAPPVKPVPVAGPAPVTPSTTLPTGAGIPGVSAPPPASVPANVANADAADAVGVLRAYFDAIGQGRYAEAYRLWGGRGDRSGMSERQFADSFTNYARYRATIGVPGRVDAGAGQRYVQIPVRVAGQLRDGTPVTLAGSVTLHKTGDIDGATPEQRSWRLSADGLKPVAEGDAIVPQ